MRTSTLLIALLGLGACGPMIPPPPAGGPIGDLPVEEGELTDGQVAHILDTINRGEIRLARLALEKNASAESNRFARRMIEDHQAMELQVEQVVARTDIVPAPSATSRRLNLETRATLARLNDLEGQAFARAYLDSQVDMHAEAITLARTELALEAERPAVRRLVTEALPTLRAHHELAIELHARLRGRVGA